MSAPRFRREGLVRHVFGAVVVCLVFAAAPASTESSTLAQRMVAAHNRVRGTHCAPPLRWSKTVAASAQKWANSLRDRGCIMQHSGGKYGENLAGGTQGTLDAERAVALWAEEGKSFSFRHGGFSMKTGHFTQLVWKGTTELGCGHSQCKGLDLWVCQYDPPGNVEGEYRSNVQAACR